MDSALGSDLREQLASAMSGLPIGLFLLHGSRARREDHIRSDWDFAYLASASFDAEDLRVRLSEALGTDDVDVVDLTRGSALLRHRVARDGILIFQRSPGEFERFQEAAAQFMCDVEPVLRRAWDETLAELG